MDTLLHMDLKEFWRMLKIDAKTKAIMKPHIEKLRAETFAVQQATNQQNGLKCVTCVWLLAIIRYFHVECR